MKTLTVKLPESLAMWLSRRAKELGRPQAELVRDALDRARRGGDSASCHDLLLDVCGVVNGPANLSTKQKYFDGFGK
jgi:Ribbon-helix-helix protein, copG family